MLPIRNLELHVTHACNLTCESCSHYSNHGHKGMLPVAEARRWMEQWKGRVEPARFSLLGGEPTVHPKLTDFVLLVREMWPATHLRIVTNGFFLDRHPELPRVLAKDPDACIYLSIHHEAPEYRTGVAPGVDLLMRWRAEHGVKVQVYRSHGRWTRRYHGYGADMQPFTDERPRESWENCQARYCPQLHEGRIWKCAALAYLPMQDEKFKLGDAWAPYLQYKPLEAGCSDEELRAFFEREEEAACGMCPAQPGTFNLPLPMRRLAKAA